MHRCSKAETQHPGGAWRDGTPRVSRRARGEVTTGRLVLLQEFVKTRAPGRCQPCSKPCKAAAAKLCFTPGAVVFTSCYGASRRN